VQGEVLGQTLEYLALQQPYLSLFSPPAVPPSPEVLKTHRLCASLNSRLESNNEEKR